MTTMQELRRPAATFVRLANFSDGAGFAEIPAAVTDFATLLVLDLIGVAAAATRMEAGRIARDHAAMHWAAGPGAPSARMLFDGRRVSLPGAAFALATQLDNLDAHDGWQPSKGHAGGCDIPCTCSRRRCPRSYRRPHGDRRHGARLRDFLSCLGSTSCDDRRLSYLWRMECAGLRSHRRQASGPIPRPASPRAGHCGVSRPAQPDDAGDCKSHHASRRHQLGRADRGSRRH